MQLARALACESPTARESLEDYACLPKQEDPDEEEARLAAIQILEEQAKEPRLPGIWKPIIASIDPELNFRPWMLS